jgi:polyhydroxybutyrate depolymerase
MMESIFVAGVLDMEEAPHDLRNSVWVCMVLSVCACSADTDKDADTAKDADAAMDSGVTESASPGCGMPSTLVPGGVQLEIDAGVGGDGVRTYWLSIPEHYDPDVPHSLIMGFAGRDWDGQNMQLYLDLEEPSRSEIFVYPDSLVRQFEGWGEMGGWLLGEHAGPATGMADLVFTEVLLDHIESTFCIDTDRVFATGQSWGGDMSHVVSCFLGHRFAASVPAAANRPYWFENGEDRVACVGETDVWTFYSIADDAFAPYESYPGEFGDQCRDFWLETRGCDGEGETIELPYGEPGDCVRYTGCSNEVQYCLYGPETGHQIPDYFSEATKEFFRSR